MKLFQQNPSIKNFWSRIRNKHSPRKKQILTNKNHLQFCPPTSQTSDCLLSGPPTASLYTRIALYENPLVAPCQSYTLAHEYTRDRVIPHTHTYTRWHAPPSGLPGDISSGQIGRNGSERIESSAPIHITRVFLAQVFSRAYAHESRASRLFNFQGRTDFAEEKHWQRCTLGILIYAVVEERG